MIGYNVKLMIYKLNSGGVFGGLPRERFSDNLAGRIAVEIDNSRDHSATCRARLLLQEGA